MKLAVIGPNLHDQSKGSFHVHTAECRDGKNPRKYPLDERRIVDADTRYAVSEHIYADVACDEHEHGSDGYKQAIESYISDFYFHNCCATLT